MELSIKSISNSLCTGCMMCCDICPKDAITFIEKSGFWYPEVNPNLCINCGLCKRRCPSLKEPPLTEQIQTCYGVRSKNEITRQNSTSGGFFSELASFWISCGGIVVGAEYDKTCSVVHQIETDAFSISRLRQSKYAQSLTEGIYKETKQRLINGEKVLFCGTPCQVEALKSFLNRDYDSLLTMDFVCLGICSPYVYRKYLDYLEQKYGSKVINVKFKDKRAGWRSIGISVKFENGREYFRSGSRDIFMTLFVKDALIMRDSCEFCKYRKLPHNSDFTVADFWGIEKINPNIDDNKGVSAVFVNTVNALKIFDSFKDNFYFFETTIEDIVSGNFSVLNPKKPSVNRKKFFEVLNSNSFKYAVLLYCSYTGFNKIRIDIKYGINYIKKKIDKIWDVLV